MKRAPVRNCTPLARRRRSHARKSPGSFLSARKDASTRADVGFDAELRGPRAEIVGSEVAEQIAPALRFVDVTRRKIFHRLAMREIEATSAGHQKFPADRALPIADSHASAGCIRDFSRTQPGGTTADNEDRVCFLAHY